MKKGICFVVVLGFMACTMTDKKEKNVVTSDIDLFWAAYDNVVAETDSLKQVGLMDSLYLQKGSPGLDAMVQARNYTAAEYVALINRYPKYWESIRPNTLKAKNLSKELQEGVHRLKQLYPELKPAKIYFTVGAMRSGGTAVDSLALIGSELAMADSNADISEFEGRSKQWMEFILQTEPLQNLVLLNIHEYVHTQQKPISDKLLYRALYEGVAEYISVMAMGVHSTTPAIAYGKNNPKVKEKFEAEMFYERTYDWLWSNSPNEFEMRDLGYYIGYSIAEGYIKKSADSLKAIKTLIELDYKEENKANQIIDASGFFSKSIDSLMRYDKQKRPKVATVEPFENSAKAVSPQTSEIAFVFSEPLNGYHTGVDFGPAKKALFPKILERKWSEDHQKWIVEVELLPNTHYQMLLSTNFRTEQNVPILPYLLDFKTAAE
ncbi:MAG: hypothetical protein AAF090_11930 [Bacteroidota bacterium]